MHSRMQDDLGRRRAPGMQVVEGGSTLGQRPLLDPVEAAKRAIANMRLPIMALPTRRFRPSERGRRTDLRGKAHSDGGGTSCYADGTP